MGSRETCQVAGPVSNRPLTTPASTSLMSCNLGPSPLTSLAWVYDVLNGLHHFLRYCLFGKAVPNYRDACCYSNVPSFPQVKYWSCVCMYVDRSHLHIFFLIQLSSLDHDFFSFVVNNRLFCIVCCSASARVVPLSWGTLVTWHLCHVTALSCIPLFICGTNSIFFSASYWKRQSVFFFLFVCQM